MNDCLAHYTTETSQPFPITGSTAWDTSEPVLAEYLFFAIDQSQATFEKDST